MRHTADTITDDELDALYERADRAEAAIARVRGVATQLEEFAENALRVDDQKLYRTIASDLRAKVDDVPGPAATEATEPAWVAAIDAFIRLEGPKVTVADDEITIEGLRIEKPARLTIHAGQRRLKLMHNALYDFSAINVCRDETCTCHAASETEKTARVFAGLHRSAEQDVTRVIALYEQWVKAGPPPLGVLLSLWWDARLAELHDAILPPTT
ncbi:hypothetical protein [Streptomyces alfalfae]|uniref:hypothetical protein n=1 Tax=Streptomyces alfalfae TaxID=1642299 RepID=UPI002811F55B|nr:hypothetical protein [Streptomyces alfalfae]